MNTDTPRTDEAAVDVWRKSNGERMATSSDKVDADFARKLERELNEARFDLDFSRRLADWQGKTIDDLTAQRDETRAESIRWQSIAEGRGRTDDDEQLTAQRDGMEEKLRIELRGHPDSELWGDAGLIAATMRCVDALDVVTEQRDMLAEALRKVSRSWNYAEVAQQALQSLTHKP
jgi:hypothetical protein